MKKTVFPLVAFIVILATGACGDNMLVETPRDFLSPDLAYSDVSGIEQGITGIYTDVRSNWYSNGGAQSYGLFGLGTDVSWDGETPGGQRFLTDYTNLTSDDPQITNWWRYLYAHIQQANTLIKGINELDEALWTSETQKRAYLAEARFFRAWSHRMAVTLWGDVPLVTEVVNFAKVDFERTAAEEVYAQIEEDLLYATENLPLPGTEPAPGRLTQGAAWHLLSEVYLAQSKHQGAVDAASQVIDGYDYTLMTERFGDQNDVFGSGDVYWDLFRYGNQSTPENTETIWAIQFAPQVEGGGGNYWSGIFGPRYFSWGNTPDGFSAFHTSFQDTLGRPVARNRGTDLVHYEVWQGDWDNDIRNAEHNIKRNFYFDNPESEYHGQLIDSGLYPEGSRDVFKDTTNYIFPFFMKTWEPVVQMRDMGGNPAQGGGGSVQTDFYAMRLAETYLLRAEAYVGLGDFSSAASDVNVVRERANASPVSPGEVDLDYILDERIRELYAEEMRMITLLRTGTLVERTEEHHNNPRFPGANIQDHNRLLPIPQQQIDLNRDADFQQNPGYN